MSVYVYAKCIKDKGIIIIIIIMLMIMKCCYVPSFAYSNVKMKRKSSVNGITRRHKKVMSLFQMTGENRVSLLNT